MQSLRINSRIRKLNLFLLKRERLVYYSLSLTLLFLIFSYAFLVAASVSLGYGIESNNDRLERILAENSQRELEYYLAQNNIEKKYAEGLVLAKNIDYIDSVFNRVVYNK